MAFGGEVPYFLPLFVANLRCSAGLQVLIALSETGGMFVHDYEVSILKEGVRESDAVTWTVSQQTLISDVDEKENQAAKSA